MGQGRLAAVAAVGPGPVGRSRSRSGRPRSLPSVRTAAVVPGPDGHGCQRQAGYGWPLLLGRVGGHSRRRWARPAAAVLPGPVGRTRRAGAIGRGRQPRDGSVQRAVYV